MEWWFSSYSAGQCCTFCGRIISPCVLGLCLGGYIWELARVLGVYLGRAWSCILYWVHQRRRLVFAIDVVIANQESMVM